MSRTPFARPYDDDTIFIPAVPDGSYVDDNSPLAETEVRFEEDPSSRHRSVYFDFHDNLGEAELEIVVGFNPISRDLLNSAITETESVHGPIKILAVTMARDNARAYALFFVQSGFQRAADRSRTTWTYTLDVEERRKVGKQRPKKARVVDVKTEAKVEDIRPTMTAQQYADKQTELERLKQEVERLERLERLREKDSE
jgi:hypothetical protein